MLNFFKISYNKPVDKKNPGTEVKKLCSCSTEMSIHKNKKLKNTNIS